MSALPSGARPGAPSRVRRLARRALRRLLAVDALREPLRTCVMTGLVSVRVWSHLAVAVPFTVAVPGGTPFRYASIPEDLMGRALYWRGVGYWEGETVAVLSRLARRARDFWDVGASTGVYTLLACAVNPAIRVVAFEPVPLVFDRLRLNVRLNSWEARCVLRPDAVGARSGTTALHVPTSEVLPTSASLDPRGFRGLPGALLEVPLTTLEAACPPDAALDLIKIDVEGYEDAVLEGAGARLGQKQPAVVVECNPDGPYRAVERRLRGLGYRFFHLGPAGPAARAEIAPDETERYRNYLCLPEAKLGWLSEGPPGRTPDG